MKKRCMAFALACCMAVCLLPAAAAEDAQQEETRGAVLSGISGLSGAQADSIWFGAYYQESAEDKAPVKWRVLDTTPNGRKTSDAAGTVYSDEDTYSALEEWSQGGRPAATRRSEPGREEVL